MASKGKGKGQWKDRKVITQAEQNQRRKLAEIMSKKYPAFTVVDILRFYEEFSEFDVDGSGDIDKFEILALFKSLGEPIPKKAAFAVINQFDTDGGGTIDFDEFMRMMSGLRLGTINASNSFLRAYLVDRASQDTLIDMARTSSTNLVELNLAGKTQKGGDERLFDALKTNSKLLKLNISGCCLTSRHAGLMAEALLDNSCLVSLDISSNAIEDEGFQGIADALCMPTDSRDAFEQVQDAKEEIEDLRQEFREVNRQYNRYLKRLRQQNGIITQQDLEGFLYNDPVARREFGRIRQKNEEMLKELEVAGLREQDARNYYENLKGNGFLQSLNCAKCYLFEASGHRLANTLKWNYSLTSINLNGNSISEGGVIAMARSLARHPTVTSLDLGGNVFGSTAGTQIAQMLTTNTALTECFLADNAIANAGAKVFTQMLQSNVTLKNLDLSGNLITASPAKELITAVQNQKQNQMIVTQITLLRNGILPEDQLEIQKMLGKDWKFKGSTEGIACKLRHMPPAEEAVAALTQRQQAMLESAFHAFDTDGSGDIDASEMFSAAEMLELEMKADEIDDMIAAIDKDGSGTLDYEEFRDIMAVMFAMNKADDDDTDDEVIEIKSDEELAAELMFASGVYDPCHVFPEAMKMDGAKQLASYPALRTGYRILSQVEKNASLSDKHQNVVKRVLLYLGWDKRQLKKSMPYTARQLRKALSHFKDISGPQPAPDSDSISPTSPKAEERLEARLSSIEIPEDDQAKLDQALLWLFRGVPLLLEEPAEED